MVTIEQVAARAGVSVATVSRVLNNSDAVRPGTAERVRAAIESLNYTPNQAARNLRRNETRVILALAPNFSNPYYSNILTGIGDLAHENGYSVFICNTDGQAENEKKMLEMLEMHRADGAIFLGCQKHYTWLADYAERFPLVQCCEYVPQLPIPSVSVDNYAAARQAVEYLLALGHRKIAILSADNDHISTELRLSGYLDAMRAAGAEVDPTWITRSDRVYSFCSGRACAERLLALPDRPTAVFCISDILALSVIYAAQDMGLAVPQELTVMGFDDIEYTTMHRPLLSTVSQPTYGLGRKSTQMLLSAIGTNPAAGTRVFLPHELRIRESSAAPNTIQQEE